MLPDRVSNPGLLTYESGALRLRYAARFFNHSNCMHTPTVHGFKLHAQTFYTIKTVCKPTIQGSKLYAPTYCTWIQTAYTHLLYMDSNCVHPSSVNGFKLYAPSSCTWVQTVCTHPHLYTVHWFKTYELTSSSLIQTVCTHLLYMDSNYMHAPSIHRLKLYAPTVRGSKLYAPIYCTCFQTTHLLYMDSNCMHPSPVHGYLQ